MTAKDIMIQTDVDGTGGLIVLREGDDPAFIKRSIKNSQKVSGPWAKILTVMRDSLIDLEARVARVEAGPVAKKKGGA
jgi:hypothetical protein